MINIEILDPVNCRINLEAYDILSPLLSFEYETRRKNQHKPVFQVKNFISKRSLTTYVGFIPRITKFCKERNIELTIKDPSRWLMFLPDAIYPTLKGITFREDQIRLLKSIIAKQRGVILAPTGSGKTIIETGLVSAYPGKKTLIIVPTLDLLTQTKEEFKRFGFKKVCALGGGETKIRGNILISTRQSCVNRIKDEWFLDVDILIIDECHLFGKEDGEMATIIAHLFCLIKIGLTATLPDDPFIKMALEGLLGPVIDEVTIKEAQENNILADLEMKFLPVPFNSKLNTRCKRYRQKIVFDEETQEDIIYPGMREEGIIYNRQRNRLIIQTIKKEMANGQVCIVFIEDLIHGEVLVEMGRKFGLDLLFVNGSTEKEDRNLLKKMLKEDKLKNIIASRVWREGINIPNLSVGILAGGGKSPSGTVQRIGRILRRTDLKGTATLYDLLDSYKYLAEHTVFRMNVYCEMGWL